MAFISLVLTCSFLLPLAKSNNHICQRPHSCPVTLPQVARDAHQSAANALAAVQSWRQTEEGGSLVKMIERQQPFSLLNLIWNLVLHARPCRTLAQVEDGIKQTNNSIELAVHELSAIREGSTCRTVPQP